MPPGVVPAVRGERVHTSSAGANPAAQAALGVTKALQRTAQTYDLSLNEHDHIGRLVQSNQFDPTSIGGTCCKLGYPLARCSPAATPPIKSLEQNSGQGRLPSPAPPDAEQVPHPLTHIHAYNINSTKPVQPSSLPVSQNQGDTDPRLGKVPRKRVMVAEPQLLNPHAKRNQRLLG